MAFVGNIEFGLGYTSFAQQARRISENWISENAYCLRCDSDYLRPTAANTRARDFVCDKCSHGYELKSKLGSFSHKIVDGAFGTMINTIRAGRTPTFLLLEYSSSWSILRLRAIHHSLITEESIQERRPLAPTARRAGWIGCNIVLSAIAVEGQISLLQNGTMTSKESTREAFGRLETFSDLSTSNRTWATTILRISNQLPQRFSLADVYSFESKLHDLFPGNRNIKPKIRQQLQFLRKAGLVHFLGGGLYERVSS